MNNNKPTVPPAFIALRWGRAGVQVRKRGIAVCDMPLVLAVEARVCAWLHAFQFHGYN